MGSETPINIKKLGRLANTFNFNPIKFHTKMLSILPWRNPRMLGIGIDISGTDSTYVAWEISTKEYTHSKAIIFLGDQIDIYPMV